MRLKTFLKHHKAMKTFAMLDELKLNYPKEPHEQAAAHHGKIRLNYKKLYLDGHFKFDPYNDFIYLSNVFVDYRNWSYYGQINEKTQRPCGFGIAVNVNGSVIMEGFFKNKSQLDPSLRTL